MAQKKKVNNKNRAVLNRENPMKDRSLFMKEVQNEYP